MVPTPPASPIADLSYRNYDGPLHTRAIRWWIVALASIRLVRKKPGFWLLALLGLLPFVVSGFRLYFQSQMAGGGGNPFAPPPPAPNYARDFQQAAQMQGLWLFAIALMTGAGSIAADNRAQALLVYLARPITKGDYLLGKWMGIFLVVLAVALTPALALYIFCLLSFSDFLKTEPSLILRVILASAVPAVIHASLLVGFSAWSKTPRMAGAAYAGFYFITGAVATMAWGIRYHGDMTKGVLERHLSPSGIIEGLIQNIYHVQQTTIPGYSRGSMEQVTIPLPSLTILLLLGAGISLLGIAAARAKIRAVEVVRG